MLRTRPLLILSALMLLALGLPWPSVAQQGTPAPLVDVAEFHPTVTNPYFPLASVRVKILEGEFLDEETGQTVHERVEERVLPDTASVAGIEVTVVEVHEYVDGQLTEHTFDYYAQHEDGTVFYFGEDVDKYEDGEMVSHEGSWRAGEGENLPGVFMPPAPVVGESFEQERAPGIAEDLSTIVAIDLEATAPAGVFSGCIRTEDINPLDGATEFKVYCPGVGVVVEENDEGELALIGFEGGEISSRPATPVP